MVLFSQNIAILEKLVCAQSYTAQSEALCALKNDTIGHVVKKEKWVELGALRPIVKVLLPERPTNWDTSATGRGGRQDTARSDGSADSRQPSPVPSPGALAEDNLARLQALELLGIFASGGPQFLAPLSAAGALPAILDYMDPDDNHPRLVYAALRALLAFINTAHLVSVSPLYPSSITIASLADTVLAPVHINALYSIIVAAPRAWWAESITNTAITIISELCVADVRHQAALAKAGILDALAVKIASYVVKRGQVVPGADAAAEKEGLLDAIPDPATDLLDVSGVLNATAAILGDSNLRTCMLLSAPPILAIFPQLEFESSSGDISAAWKALNMGGFGSLDPSSIGALDHLLPALPTQQQYPPMHGRASLSSSNAREPWNSSSSLQSVLTAARQQRQAQQSPRVPGASGFSRPGASSFASGSSSASVEGLGEDSESPMIPWLMDLVRSTTGRERLMAASVLMSIYKAGFATKPSRESAMAILIIPLLLRMLEPPKPSDDDEHANAAQYMMLETAIDVLARLVANNEVLQRAAVDGKAIRTLTKLLRESYEPVSVHTSPRPWNSTPTSSTRTGTPVASVPGSGANAHGDRPNNSHNYDHPYMLQMSSTLGPKGQSLLLAHRIRLREAVLKALTALIASKYDYQKLFVQEDAMMYIVSSLSPTPSRPRNAPNNSNNNSGGSDRMDLAADADDRSGALDCDPEYGRNPVGVLVAACNCVRMLSRSIAILRTTLEDAAVATPIYRLLLHPNINVQIASTAVVCNLVTETSPIRERYFKAGIMNDLCTHAKSHNSALRLNALWALKHLVDGVSPRVKKACLERLGSGWLLRLIDYDSESDSAMSSLYGSENGFRELSDTLATQPDVDEDVEMGQSDEEASSETNGHGQATSSVTMGKMPWTATRVVSGASVAGSGSGSSLQRARFPQTSHERSRTGRLREAEAKMAVLREIEQNTQRKSAYDDMLIQEQGLHFIRNLIGPGSVLPVTATPAEPEAADDAGASSAAVPAAAAAAGGSNAGARDPANDATDMIDYLFNEFGQDQFFMMLLRKLRPRPRPLRMSPRAGEGPSSAANRDAGRDAMRLQPPRHKMVEAVTYILVHIAAGVVRHRQIVVAQTELMRTLIANHCDSNDKGVRLAMCHLISNLTWRDSTADTMGAHQRGLELKKLGVDQQLRNLLRDEEMEVREQAKMAADQLGLIGTSKDSA